MAIIISSDGGTIDENNIIIIIIICIVIVVGNIIIVITSTRPTSTGLEKDNLVLSKSLDEAQLELETLLISAKETVIVGEGGLTSIYEKLNSSDGGGGAGGGAGN